MSVVDDIFAHARAAPERMAVTFGGAPISYRVFADRIARARAFFAGQDLDTARVAILFVNRLVDTWILGFALRELGVTTVQGRSIDDIELLALGAVTIVSSALETWPGLESAALQARARLVTVPAQIYRGHEIVSLEAPLPPGPRGGHILLTSGTTGVYKKVLVRPETEASGLAQRIATFGLSAASVVHASGLGNWTGLGYQLPRAAWAAGGGVVIHQRAQPSPVLRRTAR